MTRRLHPSTLAGLAALVLLTTSTLAQITISADDFRNARPLHSKSTGYTTGYVNKVTVQIGPASSSLSQTWNFTGLTFSKQSEYEIIPYADALQDAQLSSANLIRKGDMTGVTGKFFQYNQIMDAGYYLLGTWTEGDPAPTIYLPPVLQAVFPCQLGKSWTYQGNPREFAPGSFIETYQSTTVDAYGTIVLPQGSFPALRMKTLVRTTTTMQQLSMVRRTVAYNFVCRNGVGVFLSVDSTQENLETVSVTGVGYEVASGASGVAEPSDGGFQLLPNHPNPFVGTTRIPFDLPSACRVDIRLYSALGTEVRTLRQTEYGPGRQVAELNAAGLPAGFYFAVIRTPFGSRSMSLQLLR
jgi:hypothetical protein